MSNEVVTENEIPEPDKHPFYSWENFIYQVQRYPRSAEYGAESICQIEFDPDTLYPIISDIHLRASEASQKGGESIVRKMEEMQRRTRMRLQPIIAGDLFGGLDDIDLTVEYNFRFLDYLSHHGAKLTIGNHDHAFEYNANARLNRETADHFFSNNVHDALLLGGEMLIIHGDIFNRRVTDGNPNNANNRRKRLEARAVYAFEEKVSKLSQGRLKNVLQSAMHTVIKPQERAMINWAISNMNNGLLVVGHTHRFFDKKIIESGNKSVVINSEGHSEYSLANNLRIINIGNGQPFGPSYILSIDGKENFIQIHTVDIDDNLSEGDPYSYLEP